MLNNPILAVTVGIVLGFLSGLGVGGGSLLLLWLTLAVGMPQDIAQSVNLMFFIPAALIACLFRLKQGLLDLSAVVPALLAGVLAAVLFSHLRSHMDTQLLKKSFGILLLATGLRELFYRDRKAR